MEEATGEFGQEDEPHAQGGLSTTLTDPAWNNTTVIASDVPGQVTKLKEQYEGDVLVSASATLVDTLRAHDLVDEYHLMVYRWCWVRASACSRRMPRAPNWSWPTRARSGPTCCYSPTVRPGRASAGGVPPTARHTRAALRHGQFGGGAAPARARPYQDPVHIVRATSRSASASIRPSWRARSRMSPRRRRRGAMTWAWYRARRRRRCCPGAWCRPARAGRGAIPRAGSQSARPPDHRRGRRSPARWPGRRKAAMAAAPSSALVGQRR